MRMLPDESIILNATIMGRHGGPRGIIGHTFGGQSMAIP
jgi:hypothetical protein